MAFDSLQREELLSVVTTVARGFISSSSPSLAQLQSCFSARWWRLGRNGSLTSGKSWLWARSLRCSQRKLWVSVCWLLKGYIRVRTSVVLPFGSTGEDGGGVKIVLETAVQRVHVLPECQLLSISSAFFRQIFQFIIVHEFGEGGQSALYLRGSQNQSLAHSTSPSPRSEQMHHAAPQTWGRWTLLMFT